MAYEGMGGDKGRADRVWLGGMGRVGWDRVFYFSIGGSFTFKRQIEYLLK